MKKLYWFFSPDEDEADNLEDSGENASSAGAVAGHANGNGGEEGWEIVGLSLIHI